ncbi:hypothetical protein [uncultured Thiodictyon sp.]|uniref:hypothetical protein n=1 Tax=uncultured Thiodictyon sp. TaxID=1846217 RepID=UPI0025D5C663|nr:hypothetical protein [uncultured Thiodictyon sp.]
MADPEGAGRGAVLLASLVAGRPAAIRACRVKAMDETQSKAGRLGPGTLPGESQGDQG